MEFKPKSTVVISSEQALNASRKAKLGIKPLEYIAESVQILKNPLASWTIVKLSPPVNSSGGINPALLVIQKVDGKCSAYVYEDSGFPANNRADNVNGDGKWLFQEPTEPNFTFNSLKYSKTIDEEKDTGEKIGYDIIGSDFTGPVTELPVRSGLGPLTGTIANYNSAQGNYRAMILEIGAEDNEDGGLINLYTGYELKVSEIKVY